MRSAVAADGQVPFMVHDLDEQVWGNLKAHVAKQTVAQPDAGTVYVSGMPASPRSRRR